MISRRDEPDPPFISRSTHTRTKRSDWPCLTHSSSSLGIVDSCSHAINCTFFQLANVNNGRTWRGKSKKKKEPSGAIFISLLRESHMSLTKIVTRLSQSNQVMQLFLSILTTASTLNSVSYYLNFFFFSIRLSSNGKKGKLQS